MALAAAHRRTYAFNANRAMGIRDSVTTPGRECRGAKATGTPPPDSSSQLLPRSASFHSVLPSSGGHSLRSLSATRARASGGGAVSNPRCSRIFVLGGHGTRSDEVPSGFHTNQMTGLDPTHRLGLQADSPEALVPITPLRRQNPAVRLGSAAQACTSRSRDTRPSTPPGPDRPWPYAWTV